MRQHRAENAQSLHVQSKSRPPLPQRVQSGSRSHSRGQMRRNRHEHGSAKPPAERASSASMQGRPERVDDAVPSLTPRIHPLPPPPPPPPPDAKRQLDKSCYPAVRPKWGKQLDKSCYPAVKVKWGKRSPAQPNASTKGKQTLPPRRAPLVLTAQSDGPKLLERPACLPPPPPPRRKVPFLDTYRRQNKPPEREHAPLERHSHRDLAHSDSGTCAVGSPEKHPPWRDFASPRAQPPEREAPRGGPASRRPPENRDRLESREDSTAQAAARLDFRRSQPVTPARGPRQRSSSRRRSVSRSPLWREAAQEHFSGRGEAVATEARDRDAAGKASRGGTEVPAAAELSAQARRGRSSMRQEGAAEAADSKLTMPAEATAGSHQEPTRVPPAEEVLAAQEHGGDQTYDEEMPDWEADQ